MTKPNTKSGDAIYQLASEGIDYLDSRTDFWRQQEPVYARNRATKKPEGDGEIYRHIHRELEAIDNRNDNFPKRMFVFQLIFFFSSKQRSIS